MYGNIREEELKNKIAQDYFWLYDSTKIIGNIDFCISFHQNKNNTDAHTEQESLLWAEAKKGTSDIYNSLVQLILTIGKARTFDKQLPPTFLGAFDAEKIAFIPYNEIHDIFYINDFNWNVTPSNYETKEFKLVHQKVKHIIDAQSLLFNYKNDHKDLQRFIKANFVVGKFGVSKIKIDKNNFMVVYNKWVQAVKPSIAVNWDIAKKNGIIDGDFYLADILSQENETLKDKLYVLLKKDHYELDRKLNDMGMFSSQSTGFIDNQKAHTQFWNKYDRPPKAEYWDYIVGRRDLLVPQDVRERKGSFFTPQIWVELSQKYIANVLGDDWQDEYYVWDCACGTGNLLAGLTNKYNIWASTLDTQDVDVIKDRIKNGANLLEDHVFQFDFLNDDFTKLPQGLQDIINDPKKRKKLVVYINPPYAETSGSLKTTAKKGLNQNRIHDIYSKFLQKANHELYAQFLARIYIEIQGCKIGEFSKLKLLNGTNSEVFRNNFLAQLETIFIVPADTFDNVKGKFPIGFKIWDTDKKIKFEKIEADVFDKKNNLIQIKSIYSYDDEKGKINNWIKSINHLNDTFKIGEVGVARNDMQNKGLCWVGNTAERGLAITANTLLADSVFYSVQNSIEGTWLNDRDQFLYPNDEWEKDIEFQNDCLAYTLFNNNIQSKSGINHWIPFTEYEVGAHDKFESNFMTNFIAGKIGKTIIAEPSLFDTTKAARNTPLKFSKEAKALFNAGKKLWSYYHQQPKCNVNASLYDIREHFQGRNDAGKMNNKSQDEQYMKLISDLRENLKTLAKKIEPNVYEYGFLKA